MSRIGSIARLPAGRRGKWVVVAFWLRIIPNAMPLVFRGIHATPCLRTPSPEMTILTGETVAPRAR